MYKADLHVHSKYSGRPSDWFLKRIGARESYTSIDHLYQTAKKRGMHFVTVTDHNTIEGALKLVERYPKDTFVSAEITSYFPEDRCKVHVLVYDIDSKQFDQIDRVRTDIYTLRDYLRQENIAHSIAHGTFSVNGKLTLETLEKLILLFDVFEGLNGAREERFSLVWQSALKSLTPDIIDTLYHKYSIDPFGNTPWQKGFTGGSDDHSGIFISNCYTVSASVGLTGFIESLKRKETQAAGRCNNFKSFAFSIYKIAYDFTKDKTAKGSANILDTMSGLLFDGPTSQDKYALFVDQFRSAEKNAVVSDLVDALLKDILNNKDLCFSRKVDRIYHNVAMVFDQYCVMLVNSFIQDLQNGNLARVLRKISLSLPLVFLSAPFFSSIKHLSSNSSLLMTLRKKYVTTNGDSEKSVLWFSDTIIDLNGVSATLRDLLKTARRTKRKLKLVISHPNAVYVDGIDSDVINLSPIYTYTSPLYPSYNMHFPSLLKSIEEIYRHRPDEIVVSTPGPIGLLGLVVARLFGIPCKGIYHTDFTKHVKLVSGDEELVERTEHYVKWIYSLFDEILVPSIRYVEELEAREYDVTAMTPFRRGIDASVFNYDSVLSFCMKKEMPFENGFCIVWSGRVCRDKNLVYLFSLYKELYSKYSDTNLIVIGDGPSLDEYRAMMAPYERVVFTGRIVHNQMPTWYCLGDLLVFPSIMDTFGMTVLEAQACGCPALVTDVGGPQEIVKDGMTGFVISIDNDDQWLKKADLFVRFRKKHPALYRKMRIRVFSPRVSLYVLMKQTRLEETKPYPCRGGKDFFFINAKDGDTYPCGYRGRENLGKYHSLNWKKKQSDQACTRCDWECFRDPSELLGFLTEGVTRPFGIIKQIKRDTTYAKLWWEDVRYYKDCDLFDGRKKMDSRRLRKYAITSN